MTSLEFVEYADFSGGMNKSNTLDAIADNEVTFMQDLIPGQAGSLFSRGVLEQGISAAGVTVSATIGGMQEPHGIFTTTTTAGVQRVGLVGTTSGGVSQIFAFADDLSGIGAISTLSSAYALKATQPIVQSNPRLGGGINIGISNGYEQIYNNRNLAVWHGATKADYSTGTMSCTANSRAVTGASTVWSTNVEPGMYLFASSGLFLGMVTAVNSNTSITLDKPPPLTVSAGAYSIKCIRGPRIDVGGGLISTFTDNTTVLGSGTSFIGAGLNAFSWNIFRLSDWTYVGTVSSVSTDSTLTLTGNATVAMADEPWAAVRYDLATSISFSPLTPSSALGFLTTTYAGRQWYANMTYNDLGYGSYLDSAWYSEYGQPEVVNTSPADGNRVQIQNTSPNPNVGIRGFMGTDNGIFVAKDRETHVILGDSPDNFSNQKIVDDGCLGASTVCGWQGGVVWAGWDGIWLWDGAAPVNLTINRLGDYYKNLTAGFMENSARAWGFIYRDYYVLNVEQLQKQPQVWVGGFVGSAPQLQNTPQLQLVIHIPTRAVGFLHGVNVLGAIKYTGASYGEQTFGLVPIWASGASNNAVPGLAMYRLNNVFTGTNGTSAVSISVHKDPSSGNWVAETTAQPLPLLQTKAYDINTPLIKKAWRSLLLNYTSNADTVKVVPIIDPDFTQFTTALTDFATAASTTVKRQKFVRRSRKISFMVAGGASNSGVVFSLKSLGMTFKRLPVGRV